MNDSKMIAEIATDVKYLRLSFDEHKEALKEHIEHDEKLHDEYIKPLWDARQRNAGMMQMGAVLCGAIGGAITLAIAFISGVMHK